MKLKNKKTGEIGDIAQTSNNAIIVYYPIVDGVAINPQHRAIYESLAELNREWEDYEEPKDISEIDIVLDAIGEYCNEHSYYSGDLEKIKILNIVEEKLKAWKRLKDKEFRPKMWEWEYIYDDNISGELIIKAHIDDATDSDGKYTKDLDLLFGGEE